MIATLLAGYALALSGAETIERLDRHQHAHGSRPRKHMVVDNRGLPHSIACLNT